MCKLLKSASHPSKQKWHGGIERKYLFGKNALQREARCAPVQPPPSSTTTANIYFFPTKPPIIPSPRYLQLVKLSFAHRKVNVHVFFKYKQNKEIENILSLIEITGWWDFCPKRGKRKDDIDKD